jgi:K+-transporting ATPase ATPase A chain
LPLNPQGLDPVATDLAFNTSISFITNTNWQNYGGETTMSHLVQMLGLTVHNFVSAATGLAMAWALVRAFARSEATTIGNFWVDLTRSVLYLLLPIAVVGAIVLVLCGVPQTLAGSIEATTLEGAKQTISLGPVASQEFIKELGTNGGGFFNANSAHPLENPNFLTNMIEIWAILLIPVASVLAFGRAIGDQRQGRAILFTMGILLVAGVVIVYWSEASGNPMLTALGVDPSQGNLEGKELRFGSALTALFATATTGTSTGAVNAMHDSLMPLAGMIPLFNMLAGCIWPGGVGAGLYGFLVVAVIAVFVAGLMVGRTPEYLGKKIETREMKLAMLAVLIYPLVVLGFSAASVLLQGKLDPDGNWLTNAGPHGLSEILYAFASQNANNGSAFGGLSGNNLWFNTTGGLAMFLGRFAYVIPVLALAGSLAAKKKAPASVGTFPTHGALFVGLLIGVIIILYLLQYFPALALGPVVEHFLMLGGKTF